MDVICGEVRSRISSLTSRQKYFIQGYLNQILLEGPIGVKKAQILRQDIPCSLDNEIPRLEREIKHEIQQGNHKKFIGKVDQYVEIFFSTFTSILFLGFFIMLGPVLLIQAIRAESIISGMVGLSFTYLTGVLIKSFPSIKKASGDKLDHIAKFNLIVNKIDNLDKEMQAQSVA